MGYDDLVKLLQTRLGFRTDLQDVIAVEVKLAQYELEKMVTQNPWFLWRAADVCVDTSCLSLALPLGFLRLCEFNNPLFHAEGAPCGYQLTRAFADSTYSVDSGVAPIETYTLQNKSLRLNARAKGKLRLFYITSSAKLSDAVQQNLWTEHAFDLLLNKTGIQLAATLRDQEALDMFSRNYAIALSNFQKECVAYEDTGFEQTRSPSLYTSYNNMPVGSFFDPLTGTPCDCGGTP